MVTEEELLDPRLKKQFELGKDLLEPAFLKQRGAISGALETRGLGRSSTAISALNEQVASEQFAISDLFRDVLGKQLGLEDAEIARKFSASESAKERANRLQLGELQASSNLGIAEFEAEGRQKASQTEAFGGIASELIGLFF